MAATNDENGLILAIKDSIRQLWIIVLHPSGTLVPLLRGCSQIRLPLAVPLAFQGKSPG